MAWEVSAQLVDDLDGSSAAETVSFGLHGWPSRPISARRMPPNCARGSTPCRRPGGCTASVVGERARGADLRTGIATPRSGGVRLRPASSRRPASSKLARVRSAQGCHDQALRDAQRALALARTVADPVGLSNAFNALGEVRRRLGRLRCAAWHHCHALRLARATAGQRQQIEALLGLAAPMSIRTTSHSPPATPHRPTDWLADTTCASTSARHGPRSQRPAAESPPPAGGAHRAP